MSTSFVSFSPGAMPRSPAPGPDPLRVVLVTNFAPDRQESMLRFAAMLEAGLREAGQQVERWAPKPATVRWLPHYRYGGVAKFFGYFDKFVLFPRRVRRRLRAARRAGRAPDLVHIVDHANAVYAPLFAGLPLLATCHDLLQIRAALGEFPEHRVPPRGQRYQRWILRHISRLPHAVCDSTQTARDVERLAGLPPDAISIVPVGLNYPFSPTPPATAHALIRELLAERSLPPGALDPDGRGFLLNIGGGQWYKNRPGLITLYAALRRTLPHPPCLALVGKPPNDALRAQIASLGLEPHVVLLGNVGGPQLQALYSVAAGLVFPSLQEGFGWPVAEAQACGCPVFTSNREPMTEVGGDAAVYVDPVDPAGAARTIAAHWHRRAELSAAGLRRAGEWDPQRMIGRYLAVYRQLRARAAAS